MKNLEAVGGGVIIEPPEEIVAPSIETTDGSTTEKALKEQAMYQKRLAVLEFGDGRSEEAMTSGERNDIIFNWISTGFSKAWREYVDEAVRLNRGASIDYSKITIDNIVEFADKHNIHLTRIGHMGKN